MKKKAPGFVLLTVIGIVLILGVMVAFLMASLNQSNKLVAQSIEYHRMYTALKGEVAVFEAKLRANPDLCQREAYKPVNEDFWQEVKLDIQCRKATLDKHFQISASAIYEKANQAPIQVSFQKELVV